MVKKRAMIEIQGGGATCKTAPQRDLAVFEICFWPERFKDKISRNSYRLKRQTSINLRKPAFTMAEVLITLGIIGVVAAMTLPSLINNSRNKELEASLKKNYSVIQQALDMYQAQNETRIIPGSLKAGELRTLLMPYFNIIEDCGTGTSSKCLPNFGIDIEGTSDLYKGFSKEKINLDLVDDGQFVLNDGSLILFENTMPTYNNVNLFISVDVNGYNKRPNRWGHDLFTFQLMNDGRILPMGAEDSLYTDMNTYCSSNSTHLYNGIACTYRALTEKDYFKNLPK